MMKDFKDSMPIDDMLQPQNNETLNPEKSTNKKSWIPADEPTMMQFCHSKTAWILQIVNNIIVLILMFFSS